MIRYVYNLLTKHPKENNMTYLQHMIISLSLSSNFFIASIEAFVHAFFPFLFTTSSSDTVKHVKSFLNIFKNE